ncbi:MAG: hypothetical protein ACQETO_02480 [Pseudomonadota bacterium]
MANKPKKEAPTVDRASLSDHIEAFLKSGGEVKQIPTGTSGQTTTSGPRQIVLSHKSGA